MMKLNVLFLFSILVSPTLFALTDPHSIGNPNYPQVQVLPNPPPKLKSSTPPKEFPKECRLSALENAGTNPVEILLKDSDQNIGFAHYTASVCLTNPNDVYSLLDIFNPEDVASPQFKNKDNLSFWKSYNDTQKGLVVLCVVNQNNQFCEVTLNELQQDALVYHDRTKAIETEFFIPKYNSVFNLSEEFDIEYTADALLLKAEHRTDHVRLRFYLQK